MRSEYPARLQLDYLSLLFSKVSTYEIIIIDFTQEAYTLRILSFGRRQTALPCLGSYFAFQHIADGKHQLFDLKIIYLTEEVRLVFHMVLSRRKINFSVHICRRAVVSRCNLIEAMTPFLLETAELYQLIAHHIRIGRKSPADSLYRIADHILPILLLQGNNLETTTILLGNVSRNLYILF